MSRPDWVWDLVDLSAALAAQDERSEARSFERLQDAGRTLQVEELLLQTYLFLGFPVALEAFRRWRLSGNEPPPPREEDAAEWEARGVRACRTVYGEKYERLRENVAKLHPDLDRWMVVEGYGKVLGRPELALDLREMCIVAMLVVRGARRQLRSHLEGALNSGVAPSDLEMVVKRSGRWASAENVELARKLWNGVRSRHR